MNVRIKNSRLNGKVNIPVSKSFAHRYLLAAALTGRQKYEEVKSRVIENANDDILATVNCIENIIYEDKKADAKESGSTLRFMIPVALALGKEASFKVSDSLRKRPLEPLKEALKEKAEIWYDFGSINVKGKIDAGKYEIDAGVSSQYITGMLFALSILEGKSELKIKGEMKSAPYVYMSLDVLEKAGADISFKDNIFTVIGHGKLNLKESNIEGDWSAGAFFYVLKAFGEKIEISGLNENSIQGDRRILDILKQIKKSNEFLEIDISDIPDLAPVIALLSCKMGNVKIKGAQRLKIKESNRAEGIAGIVNGLGGKAELTEDTICIYKVDHLKGGIADPLNDHRLAMMAACMAYICKEEVQIINAQCVSKSYPKFFDALSELGAKLKKEV